MPLLQYCYSYFYKVCLAAISCVHYVYIRYVMVKCDTALSKCLREDILGASLFFGELQVRISSLPLSMGGLGITRATDFLAFAFIALRHDTLKLQTDLLAASTLPPTDPALDTTLARAPITVCTTFAQLTTGDGALIVPLPMSSACMGPRDSCLLHVLVTRILSPSHHLPCHSWRSSSLSRWQLRYLMASSPLSCLGFVLSWTVYRSGAPITGL